jgi:hypothetical protein
MSNLVKTLDETIERLTVLRDEFQVRQEEMDKALAELRKPIFATKLPLDKAIRSFFKSFHQK